MAHSASSRTTIFRAFFQLGYTKRHQSSLDVLETFDSRQITICWTMSQLDRRSLQRPAEAAPSATAQTPYRSTTRLDPQKSSLDDIATRLSGNLTPQDQSSKSDCVTDDGRSSIRQTLHLQATAARWTHHLCFSRSLPCANANRHVPQATELNLTPD